MNLLKTILFLAHRFMYSKVCQKHPFNVLLNRQESSIHFPDILYVHNDIVHPLHVDILSAMKTLQACLNQYQLHLVMNDMAFLAVSYLLVGWNDHHQVTWAGSPSGLLYIFCRLTVHCRLQFFFGVTTILLNQVVNGLSGTGSIIPSRTSLFRFYFNYVFQ